MFPLQSANTPSGYSLQRSLRFRASASAYLNRIPSVTGNQKTFTISTWLKRGVLNSSGNVGIFVAGTGASEENRFMFVNDSLWFDRITGGGVAWNLQTTQVFRDPSAWYHIVLTVDTTQATAANRVKMYVNGSLITAFTTANYPAQNDSTYVNSNVAFQRIGLGDLTPTYYLDGYLAETYLIDGQAITPSSFGSTNPTTGVWQPAPYTGTYGTNGFYLPFTDNSALTTSSNVGLGKDFSGNGNYWTTNNISITAGVTYDSMTDVPTLTSATAANYCVLSPIDNSSNGVQVVISGGNLDLSLGSGQGRATYSVSSGKWYWEIVSGATNQGMYGIIKQSVPIASATFSSADGYYYWAQTGAKYNNGSGTAYGTGLASGDVLGVAFDATAGTLTYYKNGVSLGTAFSGLSGTFSPAFCQGNTSATASFNFGQRPFAYTPPTGFVALNAYNLPSSTILKGSTAMNIALDTGANIKTATEALFAGSQYLEWIKDLANVNNHQLMNGVRGLTNVLQINTTSIETTYATPTGNSVGFAWKAGASSSSNTAGSITSTVSVNASAGISIVVFTGTGANATVGHGLGVAPKFIMLKTASNVDNWIAYHASLGATQYIHPNLTAASNTLSTIFNNTEPTSTVFSLGSNATSNSSGNTMVAICFADIDGFAKMDSYLGNGLANGTFIYTGFRPKLIMLKNASAVESWNINDTARSPYNLADLLLFTNTSNAQTQAYGIDILSNGFKIRNTGAQSNGNGNTIIYAAWAESPFKNSLAR